MGERETNETYSSFLLSGRVFPSGPFAIGLLCPGLGGNFPRILPQFCLSPAVRLVQRESRRSRKGTGTAGPDPEGVIVILTDE